MKHVLNAALAAGLLAWGGVAQASIIELTLSADWEASDFDVSSTGTTNPADPPEDDDDLVFGIAPSAGSISFTLLVDTSSVTTFLAGGSPAVAHDHFGYSDVTLKSAVSLGTATWDLATVPVTLSGPGTSTALLWTDTDLTMADPNLVSFRMFGDWTGTGGTGSADIFFGSRFIGPSGNQISDSFLTWEYFQGEEIRTTGYSASVNAVSAVPLPASSALMLAGLAGFAVMRKRRARA